MASHKGLIGLFVSVALLGGVLSAATSQRKRAILVEIHSMPRCYGLDCPPWTIPDDVDVCFQAGDVFYTGIYRPWGVPWARAGTKLLALEGKTVEILITDKHIQIVATGINLRLKRVHDDPLFRSASCAHN